MLGAVAERSRVRLSSNLELSISLVPSLFAAVTFGPVEAMLVGAASLLGDFRKPYLKWAVYTPVEAITGAASGLAAAAVSAWFPVLSRDYPRDVRCRSGCTCARHYVRLVHSCLRRPGSGARTRPDARPSYRVVGALYTPIVALLSYAYVEISPWTLPLFLVPAIAAQRLFGLYQDQRRLADDSTEIMSDSSARNMSFASALVTTLDARDQYTAGHSAAVAVYSRDIARRMALG